MNEIKTRINFDEVSKLMGLATAIVNEWPTNTNILSVVQARIKEIEAQAKEEVEEQRIETAVPGGMPANMVAHTRPLEASFPAEDTDGDGDIDEDDVQTDPAHIARNPDGSPIDEPTKPVVRRAAPTAADAKTIAGRRV